MESEIMIDSQIVVASLGAAGSVGVAGVAVLRAVWNRMADRADSTDNKISTLNNDLILCEKKHAEVAERIGNLEGWREGFAAAEEKQSAPPAASETDTA